MKKKYGLDSIIGKKSKLRYPSHITLPKAHSLYFTVPANDAISEPPLSTAITMKKGDPLEFCDQFNEESYEFEEGLPLNVIVYITVSSLLFEIKPPSAYSLLGIVFLEEDASVENFKAYKKDIFIAALNFGLIQLNPTEDFFLADLTSKVRSIYGALSTYHFRRKYPKPSRRYLLKSRFKKALLNSSQNQLLKKPQRYRLERYIKKTKKRNNRRQLYARIPQVHLFYDLLDIWDDVEDLIWEDPDIDLGSDLLDYCLLSLQYVITKANLLDVKILLNNLTHFEKLLAEIFAFLPSVDTQLELAFKLYEHQLLEKPVMVKVLNEEIANDLILESSNSNETYAEH
jgi:ribosomal protein L11